MQLNKKEKVKYIFNLIPKNSDSEFYNLLTPIDQASSQQEYTQEDNQLEIEEGDQLKEALPSTSSTSKNVFSCNTCNISKFDDLSSQREHFKTDWHRYNLKLKEKGFKSITEERFEDIIQNDCSSIEGSDSELESEEEYEDFNTKMGLLNLGDKDSEESVLKSKAKSPYIWFHWDNVGPRLLVEERFGILSRILPEGQLSPDAIIASLKHHRSHNWCVILVGGGHFSAAVFNNKNEIPSNINELKPIVSKSYHRYTTRRKQGGGQSRNDQAKGKAKSAGAQIRRENEMMLKSDIKKLLINWKQYLDHTSVIWFRGAIHYKSTIMGYEDASIQENDERVTKIPFTTKRPTYKEVVRCYQELNKVQWARAVNQQNDAVEQPSKKELPIIERPTKSKPKSPSQAHIKPKNRDSSASPIHHSPQPIPVSIPIQDIVPKVDPATANSLKKLSNLIELSMPNLLTQFELEFSKNSKLEDTPNIRLSHLPDSPTLLHVASKNNCTELIQFLLKKGYDPIIPLNQEQSSGFPYQLATNKNAKNAFRIFRGDYPDMYEYDKGAIPPSVTQEELNARAEKSKAKKKNKEKTKEKEVKPADPFPITSNPGFNMNFGFGFGLSNSNQNEEILTEREKRARAAEERIRRMKAESS
jgi:hypothetical protein